MLKLPGPLGNERGQGLVEYILVVVVSVSLILGGLYQLNTAFKGWANNYFGNYLACLLESGELPNISGGGGDGGICNEIFKPFSLADGRPLNPGYSPPEAKPDSKGGGTREGGRAGTSVGRRSGGGGGSGGGGRFAGGSFGSGKKKIGATGRRGASATYTGSTAAGDYGNGSGRSGKRNPIAVKPRLDNRFALQDERERPQKRSVAGGGRRPQESGGQTPRVRVKRTDVKKSATAEADSGLTLPSFLKWLVIAGIIIALIVVLGGQSLQIGKSMD